MDEAVEAEGVGVWPCGTKRGTAFTSIATRSSQARPATLPERGRAFPGAILAIPCIPPQPAPKSVRARRGDLSR